MLSTSLIKPPFCSPKKFYSGLKEPRVVETLDLQHILLKSLDFRHLKPENDVFPAANLAKGNAKRKAVFDDTVLMQSQQKLVILVPKVGLQKKLLILQLQEVLFCSTYRGDKGGVC